MIDILLPVFNAFEDVVACLDSVLAHTDSRHIVYVLDDASPDQRIGEHVGHLAAQHPHIIYRPSAVNLGFVGNVNRALDESRNDVILLNSDTLVTPGWLEAIARCRDSSGSIGIVCPLSNNATILSVPAFNADNPLPVGMSPAQMAALVASCSQRAYPRIPTAVGFCMLITRSTIDALGGLDPAYGKGYGEECDYSMRAWRLGIEIACCDDAFVFHRGHASFGEEGAINAAKSRNEALLNQRWPGYVKAVQAFCADNPLRPLQETLKAHLAAQAEQENRRPHVLQMTHRFGSAGGVEEHVRDLSNGLAGHLRFSVAFPLADPARWADFSEAERGDALRVVRWHPRVNGPAASVFGFPTELELTQARENLTRFFAGNDARIVHIQHFANWQSFDIPSIAKLSGKKVVISLHDYHLLCPNYNLLLPSLKRCGQPVLDLEQELCRQCLGTLVQPNSPASEQVLAPAYSRRRQQLVRAALEAADAVIAPSEFVRSAFGLAFGATVARRIRVIQHGVAQGVTARHAPDKKKLRIACLGNLNAAKGASALIEAIKQLQRAPISFAIHGNVEPSFIPALTSLGVHLGGGYRREEIASRLENVDAVLVLSIVDETFCMAVSEAQSAGVPVIVPRVGGITERIRHGGDGFLYDAGDVAGLRELLTNFAGSRARLETVRRNLTQSPPKGIDAMLGDYLDLYRELLSQPRELKSAAVSMHAGEEPISPVPPAFVQDFDFPDNLQITGDKAYGAWHALRQKLGDAVQTASAGVVPPAHVHWLVLADASNCHWVERTLASIRRCGGFDSAITILADRAGLCDALASFGPCRFFDSQEALNQFVTALCRGTADSPTDWVAFLPAGDLVAADIAGGLSALAKENPLADIVYFDEDRVTVHGQHYAPFFKPDMDRAWAMSSPYTGRLVFCRPARLTAIEVPIDWLGMAAYAIVTAGLLQAGSRVAAHLPGVHHHALDIPGNRLHDWLERAACVLHHQLERQGIPHTIDIDPRHGYYRALLNTRRKPGISIVVASATISMLEQCLNAIYQHTDYPDFEVLVVLTGTQDPAGIEPLVKRRRFPLTVHQVEKADSYAAALQFGCKHARKELLVLLSDGALPTGSSWLDEIALGLSDEDAGAIGGRVVLPQQGIVIGGFYLGGGMKGIAHHAQVQMLHQPRAVPPREFSALPGECIAIRNSLLQKPGGIDCKQYGHDYWPIDLCLRVRDAGYRVCWTPRFSVLCAHGPSHLAGIDTAQRAQLEAVERSLLFAQWPRQINADPASNPCLGMGNRSAGALDTESVRALKIIAPDRPLAPGLMVFPFDEWGSGQYRARLPATALQDSGTARVRIMASHQSGLAATPPEVWRFAPETLLLHNFLHDYQLDALALFRKHCDVRLVFGLDDLLTDIPEYNPFHQTIYADIETRLAKALVLCDRLIVTTDALANRFDGMIRDVRVIPNYLDAQHWNVPPRALADVGHRRLRVGWAGARQHMGDLRWLAPVVMQTCREVDWIFFGMCPPEIAPYAAELHEMVPFDRYPARLAELAFDVALAPLVDNAFNRAKSSLRLLEYGVLGTAVICSDIEPYRGAPAISLVNDVQQWTDAILHYAENPQQAVTDGHALQRWVSGQWMLQQNLDAWSTALELSPVRSGQPT